MSFRSQADYKLDLPAHHDDIQVIEHNLSDQETIESSLFKVQLKLDDNTCTSISCPLLSLISGSFCLNK